MAWNELPVVAAGMPIYDSGQLDSLLRMWQPVVGAVSKDAEGEGLNLFDKLVDSESICSASRQLFADGHYALAVLKAFVCLEKAVKEKSHNDDKYGTDLMQTVFRPESPALKFNNLLSKPEKAKQLGYMYLYAGAMAVIRNSRAHEPEYADSRATALKLLGLADYLMDELNDARYCERDLD